MRGYDARAVYDLADLEPQIQQAGDALGAIVMDVVFPEATTGGIDIINKFRKDEILQAPVIFISASDSFSIRLEIVRAGGDAFFVKPFDNIERLALFFFDHIRMNIRYCMIICNIKDGPLMDRRQKCIPK